MKRPLVLIPLAAVLVLAVAVAASAAGGHKDPKAQGKARHGKTITVVEHATTDATTDTGAAGDSAGDVLTFANDVFDAKDANKVGTDQGSCIRIVPGESYECAWTTTLARGQIMVQGPFYDTRDSVLAVTGGTGRYRNARGYMQLHSLANGTKYTFTFHLVG